MYYWIVKGIFWPAVKVYFRFSVKGRGRIPRRGPLLIVANHTSFLDPILLGSAFPRRIRFVVRQSMYEMWRVCWFYVGMGTVPVRASEGDPRAIRNALKILDRGQVLGIFPEGARSGDGRLRMGKMGSAFLAAKSGVPVLPARISGAREAMPPGSWFPRPSPVQVAFGETIRFPRGPGTRVSRSDLEAFSRTIQDSIGSLLKEENDSSPGGGHRP